MVLWDISQTSAGGEHAPKSWLLNGSAAALRHPPTHTHESQDPEPPDTGNLMTKWAEQQTNLVSTSAR